MGAGKRPEDGDQDHQHRAGRDGVAQQRQAAFPPASRLAHDARADHRASSRPCPAFRGQSCGQDRSAAAAAPGWHQSCFGRLSVHLFFCSDRRSRAGNFQVGEGGEAVVQHPVGVGEGQSDFNRIAFHRRRVGHAPMRRHRLARPDGTHFARRAVADGDHEIQRWGAGRGELVPGLGTKRLVS